MTRFYFDTVNGGRHPDEEGTELPDAATARVEAVRLAGTIIADDPSLLIDGQEFALQVSDEARKPVFTLMVAAFADGASLLKT